MEHNHFRDLRPGHDRPLELLMGSTAGHGLHRVPFPICYGPEFVSRKLNLRAYAKGVVLDFSLPGKPRDNANVEALNNRFRRRVL